AGQADLVDFCQILGLIQSLPVFLVDLCLWIEPQEHITVEIRWPALKRLVLGPVMERDQVRHKCQWSKAVCAMQRVSNGCLVRIDELTGVSHKGCKPRSGLVYVRQELPGV